WAAEYGYLDLLKWAHERHFPLLQLRDGKAACAAAAKGGHLVVLQWLREQKCRWDAKTMEAAAAGGHLAVVKWMRERGCAWNSKTAETAAESGHLAVTAAESGHLLQWLRANG